MRRLLPVLLLLATTTARADDHPRYFPTFAIAAGFAQHDDTYLHLWLGVTYTPPKDDWYLAGGLDLDYHGVGDYLGILPIVRAGYAWYLDDGSCLPFVRVYGLAGAHIPSAFNPTFVRLGAGLSLPALWPIVQWGVPTMVEVTVDTGATEHIAAIRVGWEI